MIFVRQSALLPLIFLIFLSSIASSENFKTSRPAFITLFAFSTVIVDGVLKLKSIDKNIYEASDKRLNQISEETEITPGVYFITVKGDADLVIDTISINEQNLEAETQRIKEYLENNDCYKDK